MKHLATTLALAAALAAAFAAGRATAPTAGRYTFTQDESTWTRYDTTTGAISITQGNGWFDVPNYPTKPPPRLK